MAINTAAAIIVSSIAISYVETKAGEVPISMNENYNSETQMNVDFSGIDTVDSLVTNEM